MVWCLGTNKAVTYWSLAPWHVCLVLPPLYSFNFEWSYLSRLISHSNVLNIIGKFSIIEDDYALKLEWSVNFRFPSTGRLWSFGHLVFSIQNSIFIFELVVWKLVGDLLMYRMLLHLGWTSFRAVDDIRLQRTTLKTLKCTSFHLFSFKLT